MSKQVLSSWIRAARLSLVAWVLLGSCHRLFAEGERSNVRGIGMARTFVVGSRGLDAVAINPANLAYPADGAVTFSFLPLGPLGLHVGTDFLDYGLYTTYFTGVETDTGNVARYLTPPDKQRILDAFSGSGGKLTADVEALLFGITVRIGSLGAAAFTVTEQAGGYVNIPRDYAAFLFNGNPPGTTYDFGATDVKASWTRTYALSYGGVIRQPGFLKSLAAGGAIKLIHGFGYADVQRFNTVLSTAANGVLSGSVHLLSRAAGADFLEGGDHSPGYQPFPKPAGSGYAVDLGVAGAVNDYLSFGLSVTDVGAMRWNANVQKTSVDTLMVVDDPLVLSNRDGIERTLKGRKGTADPFYSNLPTQLRMGVAVQVDKLPAFDHFPGTMLAELDYNQGFQNTPGSTRIPRVSLGVEYLPLGWLPLRTGVSFGGIDHFNLAFGFGLSLGVFEFGLASENVSWLFEPTTFSQASISMGMRWRIG